MTTPAATAVQLALGASTIADALDWLRALCTAQASAAHDAHRLLQARGRVPGKRNALRLLEDPEFRTM